MRVFPHWYLGNSSLLTLFQFRQFHFKNFYHPFVCDFAKLVYNPLKGIPALMSRETQLKDTGFSFRPELSADVMRWSMPRNRGGLSEGNRGLHA